MLILNEFSGRHHFSRARARVQNRRKNCVLNVHEIARRRRAVTAGTSRRNGVELREINCLTLNLSTESSRV